MTIIVTNFDGRVQKVEGVKREGKDRNANTNDCLVEEMRNKEVRVLVIIKVIKRLGRGTKSSDVTTVICGKENGLISLSVTVGSQQIT